MSLAFLGGGILAFLALVAIAERWSIIVAGALVMIVAVLLACSSA